MRTNAFTFLCFLFISITGISQVKFAPKGIVLYPFEKEVTANLRDSIASYKTSTEVTEEAKKQFIPANLPVNWKLVRENELAIMARQDYFSSLSLQLEREINYKLVENYTYPLIVVVQDSSKADVLNYKKLIADQKVDWVINPYSIKISKVGAKYKMDVKFQAYYHPLGYTILNTTFSVSEADIAGCEESSLTCLLNAAAKKMADLAVDKIERVR